MSKKDKSLPYDDPMGEPLDGRDSQPMETGDQDYPETLDAEDPLRDGEIALADRGMHLEDEYELGFQETRVGIDTENASVTDEDPDDQDDDEA